jgi:hypothetical protein
MSTSDSVIFNHVGSLPVGSVSAGQATSCLPCCVGVSSILPLRRALSVWWALGAGLVEPLGLEGGPSGLEHFARSGRRLALHPTVQPGVGAFGCAQVQPGGDASDRPCRLFAQPSCNRHFARIALAPDHQFCRGPTQATQFFPDNPLGSRRRARPPQFSATWQMPPGYSTRSLHGMGRLVPLLHPTSTRSPTWCAARRPSDSQSTTVSSLPAIGSFLTQPALARGSPAGWRRAQCPAESQAPSLALTPTSSSGPCGRVRSARVLWGWG